VNDLDPRLIAASILLAELVVSSKGVDVSGLEDVLPDARFQERWADAARRWASDVEFKESFRRWSEEIESAYSVGERIRKGGEVRDVGSFKVVDEVLLEEVARRLADGSVESIRRHRGFVEGIANVRLGKFWAREGDVRDWDALQKAMALYRKLEDARREMEQMQGKEHPPLKRYFDDWWRIDQLYREFAASTRGLTHPAITNLKEPIRRMYQDWVDQSNTYLSDLAGGSGRWPIGDFLFQSEFWDRFVKGREKTCLILLDALRYELQKRLEEMLERRTVTHTPMLSCLPSITEVCMSALLPHKSIDLQYAEGRLGLYLDGRPVTSKGDREKWLREIYGDKVAFRDLDGLSRGGGSLDSQFLVVWGREIDRAGSFLSVEMLDYPDALLEKVVAVVEAVARAGFSRIIIVTDHGFLFVPDPQRVEVAESFLSAGLVYARRYAVGRPPRVEGCFILRLRSIGYESDGEILFPRGISYLPRKGEKESYVHGGVSLQECCIGVLEVRPQQVADRVMVKIELPEIISSRMLKVRIVPHKYTFSSPARKILVELLAGGRLVDQRGPIEVRFQAQEVWLKVPASSKHVDVRVKDADTREILEKRTARVALEGYDDLL